MEPKFSELKKGDKAEIIGYNTGDSQYKSKLLSMGLVRGVVLQVLGDLRAFYRMDCHLGRASRRSGREPRSDRPRPTQEESLRLVFFAHEKTPSDFSEGALCPLSNKED